MKVTTLPTQSAAVAVLDTETSFEKRLPTESQVAARRESGADGAARDEEIVVVVARDVEQLRQHEAAWQDLAQSALEANINYEPCLLLPAVEAFGATAELYFVLLYATDPLRPRGAKILCGVFPLERVRRYKGLPVSTFRLWKHEHSYLCTPLLRCAGAGRTLAAFFDWLESKDAPCRLMAFSHIAGDGDFHKLLLEELNRRGNLSFHDEWFNRALYQPRANAAAAVEGISGRHRKELRRKRNRLAELGEIEFLALEEDGDLDRWIADFLSLEAKGWKGEQQTAFASDKRSKRFFEEAARRAFARGQLMMLALCLDGVPIAMKCNFLSGRGSFAFKIAFDEDFARYSPGVLLELENLERLATMPAVEWMDSCAAAEHFMINRLWTARRLIETIVVSTGKGFGDLLVSTLPLLRWLKRRGRAMTKR